ncbi:MAG: hypothetical protein CM15mP74_26380 [Halieaceae bacterium]|nr:MAG: hypothetical protein CM15mP74_26380 [Halieaceae bacterium]
MAHCVASHCDLSDLSLTDLQGFHSAIQEDVFDVLTLEGSVSARNHFGGTSPERVREAAAAPLTHWRPVKPRGVAAPSRKVISGQTPPPHPR